MATRTGVANLPLHYGRAPRWLFERMTQLARELLLVMRCDFGADEVLRRLSDPFWFQALGCVLGFDWHSSGVTTTLCGALKEAVRGIEGEVGLYVAGGKGRASRRTPQEIAAAGETLGRDLSGLVYASRMAAKVDSAAVQDGYQIYHHAFFFTPLGEWAVVQQGMNEASRYARRYHWLGEGVRDFVDEPHAAIAAQTKGETLDLVAHESSSARETIAGLIRGERPEPIVADLGRLQRLYLPSRHLVSVGDIHPERLERILLRAYEARPPDFESLLGLEGLGAKTLRALSLLSELVYGAPVSHRDPARYSFAHGGKDGHPYPVDRVTYDASTRTLNEAVRRARLGERERLDALRRLARFTDEAAAGAPVGDER